MSDTHCPKCGVDWSIKNCSCVTDWRVLESERDLLRAEVETIKADKAESDRIFVELLDANGELRAELSEARLAIKQNEQALESWRVRAGHDNKELERMRGILKQIMTVQSEGLRYKIAEEALALCEREQAKSKTFPESPH